ncbi:hypothetical protein [Algoriphagus sp. Y33]|uniref:hypothetical protein n=1 Tax=Algoriphagus sp. Y33 TaxID=2772483 RepID=UPI0017854490|nr:hypothetical protein [Algoriphagus sp. Y33]
MKLTTINLLRGGVFSLAVVAAFAFTQPQGDDPRYATLDEGDSWIWVNDPGDPVAYECIDGNEVCLYTQEDMAFPAGPATEKFQLQ